MFKTHFLDGNASQRLLFKRYFNKPANKGGIEDTRLKAKDTKKSEAKDSPFEDRPSRGQGHECLRPRTQAQVFSKIKKVFKNFFQAISKRGKQKNPEKFSARFLAFSNLILTVQKTVLSSSRGLEASRPRTSKCVLEAKDVLEDYTSANQNKSNIKTFLF